jgi:hypothetical protein
MRMPITLLAATALAVVPASMLAQGLSAEQKAKTASVLKELREKAKSSKQEKYEIAIPVASAGVRGAEVRQSGRFAVIWPDGGIVPLTALAENIQHGAAQGEAAAALLSQIEEFKKAFPEFAEEKLLKDLADAISQPAK